MCTLNWNETVSIRTSHLQGFSSSWKCSRLPTWCFIGTARYRGNVQAERLRAADTQLTSISNGMYLKKRAFANIHYLENGAVVRDLPVRRTPWDYFLAAPGRANIFLRKTATSLFAHTSHIHRSSRGREITRTALNIHVFFPLLFFLFWCLFWLWSLVLTRCSVITNRTEDGWCFYLQRINGRDRIS